MPSFALKKALGRLPVETLLRKQLGFLMDVEIERETGRLAHIVVGRGWWMRPVAIIPWSAIVRIEQDRLVVIDTWREANGEAFAAKRLVPTPALATYEEPIT